MNFTGNNKELLLVHTSMKRVTLSNAVNIMLTPQFYTLKKEALPIRYAYQAKRIAPSLFDGLLEDDKYYEYLVWKEKEEWVFLAYDPEMITTFLETKGFTLENVSKIFFAQQSIDSFIKPLLLGENEALVSLDHTVVIVPRAALGEDESPSLAFDSGFTPKKGITLNSSYGSILSLKQAFVLSTVFMLFMIMFFIEGWRYSDNAKAGNAEMQRLYEAYPSLQSKYTRDSISAKYKTIDTIERKKRKTIKTLSKMIFKGVALSSLTLNEKNFKVYFSCSDATVRKRLKALAKKENFNTKKVTGSNDLQIEGRL